MKHGCGPLYLKWAGGRLYGPGRLPAGETVGLLGGLMTKLYQRVCIEMQIANPNAPSDHYLREELEGTNHTNLRSKITEWISLKLVQWNVMDGATIKISIAPAEHDEFSRPDPD